MAFHDAAHALADDGLEGLGRGQRRQVAPGRVGHNGAGQGVLALRLQGGGQTQGVIGNVAGHNDRLALGEGARLVEDGCRQVAHGLQHRAVLDEHAELRALPHTYGERRGGRKAQRAGARHADDGDGRHERLHQAAVGASRHEEEPHAEHGKRDQQDGGHEHRRDAVSDALDGGFGALGVFHGAHDASQRGIGAHAQGAHGYRTSGVLGAAGHRVALGLHHGQRLAGQHGLVHFRGAFHHHTIDRHLLARPHEHRVAGHHLGQGHLALLAAADHPRRWRGEVHERLDGLVRGALGAAFQHLAKQHEGDEHGTGLEIGHAVVDGERRMAFPIPRDHRQKRDPQREQKRNGGTERHEHIHVRRAALKGAPRALVEPRAATELHRGRKRQQQEVRREHGLHMGGIGHEQPRQGRAHPHVPAGNHADGHNSHREHGRHAEHLAIALGPGGLAGAALLVHQRCVLGDDLGREGQIVEDGEHVVHAGLGRVEHNAPRVVGQVHRHIDDAGRGAVVLLDVGRAVRAVHALDGQPQVGPGRFAVVLRRLLPSRLLLDCLLLNCLSLGHSLPSLLREAAHERHHFVDHLVVAGAHLFHHAGAHMLGQHHLGDAPHRRLGGGQLGEHVPAVAVVLDHGLHAVQLPDGPVQPLLHIRLQLGAARCVLVPAGAIGHVARSTCTSLGRCLGRPGLRHCLRRPFPAACFLVLHSIPSLIAPAFILEKNLYP